MSEMLEHINSIGQAFVEFAWPLFIRSSALMAILLLVELLLRKRVRAAIRYWMWMLLPMQLLVPVSVSWFVKMDCRLKSDLASVSVSFITPAEILTASQTQEVLQQLHARDSVKIAAVLPKITWQGTIFLIWLAIVAAMVLLLVRQTLFARRIVAQAQDANALMKDILGYCCTCIGVRRKVRLKVSADATSPIVCGLLRPVILVPRNLAVSLGSRHLRSVLLHELAHIKRGDLGLNLVQTILQIAYFYNPLLWLVNSVIRTVREQAVDENVLAAVGEKTPWYPETLTNVAGLDLKDPGLGLSLVGVVESKSALVSRITHILNLPWPRKCQPAPPKADMAGQA
jgi:beta-lactamase regulating signal transducer with metallopeptidase domain